MTGAWLYASGAMACMVMSELWAQAAPPQNRPSDTSDTRHYVVIGCLSDAQGSTVGGRRTANSPRFLVTDMRGGPVSKYRLEGDDAQLRVHVGHTVEIAGPLSAGTSTRTGPNAGAPMLKVQSLTYLSPNCSK